MSQLKNRSHKGGLCRSEQRTILRPVAAGWLPHLLDPLLRADPSSGLRSRRHLPSRRLPLRVNGSVNRRHNRRIYTGAELEIQSRRTKRLERYPSSRFWLRPVRLRGVQRDRRFLSSVYTRTQSSGDGDRSSVGRTGDPSDAVHRGRFS